MPLSSDYSSILWDQDISLLDLEDDIVALRVFSLGDKHISDSWILSVSQAKARKIFIKIQDQLDNKSANYWQIYFRIRKRNTSQPTMYEQLNTPLFSRNIR